MSAPLAAWGDSAHPTPPPSYGLAMAVPTLQPPPTEYEIRAQLLSSNPLSRESYIPISDRVPAHQVENDGKERDSYFVYLPKETMDVSGKSLRYITIPEGANLFKGIRSDVGVEVACAAVNRPENPICRHCETYAWYSDYITALLYSTSDPPRMQTYCFKTVRPLRLLNLMDKRNLDVIMGLLTEQLGTDTPLPNPYLDIQRRTPVTEVDLYTFMKSSIKEQINVLMLATGYAPSPDMAAIWRTHGIRIHHPERTEERPAADIAELEEEFGDQDVLQRFSREYIDLPMIRALKAVNETMGLGFDGYYSATYKKFNREIGLFHSKGLLRHDATDPRSGCVFQAAASPYASSQTGGRRHRRRITKRRRQTRR